MSTADQASRRTTASLAANQLRFVSAAARPGLTLRAARPASDHQGGRQTMGDVNGGGISLPHRRR
jgi:hypothetical protein